MGFFSKKSDRWERNPDDIAVRIESSDVKKGWVTRPFIVFDGTVALVFSKGKLLGRLASGKHDIDGPFRKWLAGDAPTTLVIVDDGHLTLDVNMTNLYDRDNITLDMVVRLTLNLDDPEAFYRNVMKDRKHYLMSDLSRHLHPELLDALLALTSTHPIDDLYHNAELKQQAESQIYGRLGEVMARLGFVVISLNIAKVTSSQFDSHRAQQAEEVMHDRGVDIEAHRLKVLQRARMNTAADKIHQAVTQSEFLETLHQATHELGLKDTLRADELARLNTRLEHDAKDYELQRAQNRESEQLDHTLEVDTTKRKHDRQQKAFDLQAFLDQRINEADTRAHERHVERQEDEKDFDLAIKMRNAALEARRRMKKDDAEILAEKAVAINKMDTSTKIALGLGDKEALLELERLEQEGRMTPDQLLIKAAEKSSTVAAALIERFKSEGKLNDDIVDQLKRQMESERLTNREHSAQLERVMNQALQQMGMVAQAKAQNQNPGSQTIVTGGSMGTPIVINPNQPQSPGDDEKKS